MASHCRNQILKAVEAIAQILALSLKSASGSHVNRLKQKSQLVSSCSIRRAEKTQTEVTLK